MKMITEDVTKPMSVCRIHIRPKGGKANPEASFAYCFKEQVLGLGWQTKSHVSGITWNDYEKEATSIHGVDQLSRVRYLKERLKPGDLIWTRDMKGCYYLAKVLSGWEYFTNKEAQDADIANVVRCRILKVPSVDCVPGKVFVCFRATRTIQRIHDLTTEKYSLFLWNKLSKSKDYRIDLDEFKNIFSLLDAEQTEDVIFIYLQTKGWIVVPNSRKADTMSYEFYLIRKDGLRRAVVQVKTGHSFLNPQDWAAKKEYVFLFQSNGLYQGSKLSGVECIEPRVIEDFIYKNPSLIPENIFYWARMCSRKKCEKC